MKSGNVHLVEHLFLCYTVLTRANQLETAVHGCRILLILGLVSITDVCVVLSFLRSPISCAEIRLMNIFSLIVFVVKALKSDVLR